jgi:hypothetical protein
VVSQEENNIRIQEDDFFDQLNRQKPAKLDSIMTLRSDGMLNQQNVKKHVTTTKRKGKLSTTEERPRMRRSKP